MTHYALIILKNKRNLTAVSYLSILNLNTMHGRNSRSPIFPPIAGRKMVQNNLRKITKLISDYSPDVVTLQEVDEYSILSGGFNQFDLGVKAGYKF